NDNKRIKECTDAVINFIVGFQIPFSVVGNFYKIKFIKYLKIIII
ncbi:22885_t:CDS:1, partial [Entrophospora sp. SA101]